MFKVYQGEDKDFHQIHDLIIRKQSNKFSPVSSQHSYGMYFLISKVCFIMHNETYSIKIQINSQLNTSIFLFGVLVRYTFFTE